MKGQRSDRSTRVDHSVFLIGRQINNFQHLFHLWMLRSSNATLLRKQEEPEAFEKSVTKTYTHTNTYTHTYTHTLTRTSTKSHTDRKSKRVETDKETFLACVRVQTADRYKAPSSKDSFKPPNFDDNYIKFFSMHAKADTKGTRIREHAMSVDQFFDK